MENERKFRESGITLVALVITIILLLILAGISIASLTNSGLFEKAREAENKSKEAEEKQGTILEEYEKQINENIKQNEIQNEVKTTYLCEKFYIQTENTYERSSNVAGIGKTTSSQVSVYSEYTFSETEGFKGTGTRKTYSNTSTSASNAIGMYQISKKQVSKVTSFNGTWFYATPVEKANVINSTEIKGTTTDEIVESTNRNEYPDAGVLNSYWYEYRGIKE